MMTLLSGLLSGAVGKYATSITLPAMVFGLLLLGHQFIGQRDAKLQAQATNVCDKNWETEIRKQERDAAQADAVAAREMLEGERQVNQGLNNELEKIRIKIAAAQTGSPPVGADPNRCLSDGVLDVIGGHGPGKRGTGKIVPGPGGGGGGNPASGPNPP